MALPDTIQDTNFPIGSKYGGADHLVDPGLLNPLKGLAGDSWCVFGNCRQPPLSGSFGTSGQRKRSLPAGQGTCDFTHTDTHSQVDCAWSKSIEFWIQFPLIKREAL
jgi:hypothetical protein